MFSIFRKINYWHVIFVIFVTTFLIPLIIFKVPLQADDIYYYYGINSGISLLKNFYEFLRLPPEGLTLFYSYKVLFHLGNKLNTNIVLIFYFLFHLFSSFMLYHIIFNLMNLIGINKENNLIALYTALIFLVSPIAVDSFANLSLTVRNIGLFFILAGIYFKIKLITDYNLKSLVFYILNIIIGLNFYEVYIVYLPVIAVFVLLANNKRKAFFCLVLEYIIIFLPLILKFMFILNNVESRGITTSFAIFVKHYFSYIISILIPHLHGFIFVGVPVCIFIICSCTFLYIIRFLKVDHKEKFLSIILALLILLSLGVFSLNPYFVPRALYAITPILSFFMVIIFCAVKNKFTIYMFIFFSIISMWQFFHLQDKAYYDLDKINKSFNVYMKNKGSIPNKIIIDNYSKVGVRLFLLTDSEYDYTIGNFFKLQNNVSSNKSIATKINFLQEKKDESSNILIITSRLSELFNRKKMNINIY